MAQFSNDVALSPRKRSRHSDLEDHEFTPKRLRIASHLATPSRSPTKQTPTITDLPSHLSRLYTIQNGLQHALSHALASCAVAPSADTGIVRGVLNHISLQSYSGIATQFSIDDLRRLCWIWEWDGKTLPKSNGSDDDDDNPFMDEPKPPQVKDWSRGAMGFVLTAATHHSKTDKRRTPAYGIGIEVECDLDKGTSGGMAAVARWTAAAEQRKSEFRTKLVKWTELHPEDDNVPQIPLADLPALSAAAPQSSLTRVFASLSPKSRANAFPTPALLASPSRSPAKRVMREFVVPDLPITPSSRQHSPIKPSLLAHSSPIKNTVPFPQTPSRKDRIPPTNPNTPTRRVPPTPARTPTTSGASLSDTPGTPVHQRGRDATTVPQTPTSSRRQALYDRVRQRSLQTSPTRTPKQDADGTALTRDQILKMGQENMRRRVLLGRLPTVAESLSMMFAAPTAGTTVTMTPSRKRRTLRTSEVAASIMKSSSMPISSSDANEMLGMLAELCPFFVKSLNLDGEEWLEMPKQSDTLFDDDPNRTPVPPPSPSRSRTTKTPEQELLTRSPKRVTRQVGGLRQVREVIRRELDLID
ncbi:hypothetical protein CYLTODRAFT_365301 [Cylindrobasidium torrendii FP15055 ss-10]|uniref:DNA replication factor Cdt1 C-terminal domain-containing protein n=1 Tax=Cylindrobasidium torrendii FP15055 ss-10 TaxID=1314674 RepID=A0A0D7BTN5_9AGAR|nr:hypothetical protein CYLTODRAFT_365301 [Cylindrobasidium torrendii FP15055 ss-10]